MSAVERVVEPRFGTEYGRVNPLRRRQDAARRLPPLPCGHRDPLIHLVARGPSTYGLPPDELRRYARELWWAGWQLWEITGALDVVEELAS